MAIKTTLTPKDYKAIGLYAEVHHLRLMLADVPNWMIYFESYETGERTSIGLITLHDSLRVQA